MPEAQVQARVPPHDLEAERLVLGGIVVDNTLVPPVREVITEQCFYLEAHKEIFRASVDLYDRDEPVDLVTLRDELSRRGVLEKVGGVAYLSRLITEVSAVTNIPHYAQIVSQKFLLRSLIAGCNRVMQRCYEGSDDVQSIIQYAEQVVSDVAGAKLRPSILPVKEVVRMNLETLEQLATGEKKFSGIPTGFTDLDGLILGLHPGDLIIVGSRPSVGKTSLCLNIAYYAALKASVPVLIFTIEMSKEEITNRLLAAQAGVGLTKIRSGKLSKTDRKRLNEAGALLSELPIFIDDSATLTPLEMRSRAKMLKAESDVGLVMVDYIQLMHYHKRSENRQQEVTAISRSLKSMARELDIPVVAFSQLSREITRRKESRVPQLADLRESGSLEQDADVVIFLHDPSSARPGRRKEERRPKPEAIEIDVIVAKQRNGPTDTVRLLFQTRYASFKNISKQAPPPWVTQEDEDLYTPEASEEV